MPLCQIRTILVVELTKSPLLLLLVPEIEAKIANSQISLGLTG